MDEVFGNSSSETVMEADLSRVLANINQDIAELQHLQMHRDPHHSHHHMSTSLHPQQHQLHLQQQAISSTTNMAHIVNRVVVKPCISALSGASPRRENMTQRSDQAMTPRNTVAHVSVITSIGKRVEEGPVPQPRSLSGEGNVALRHTQSAVVTRVCHSQTSRPRALSTGTTTHQLQEPSHHQMPSQHQQNCHGQHYEHSYVNLQPSLNQQQMQAYAQPEHQSVRPVSTYDNVPSSSTQVTFPSTPLPPQSAPPMLQSTPAFPQCEMSSRPHIAVPQYMNVPLPSSSSPTASRKEPLKSHVGGGGSSSAPATPRGGGNGSQRLHHSYIELWSGVHEERDSLSDSECEELKRSFQDPHTPSHRHSQGYVEMSSPYIKSPQVASPFNGSVLADLATKLASYAGHQPRNIFCPFCPRYFGYEKSLGSHIHKTHKDELNSMVENRCGDIQLQFCPICQAQFFNTSVLPKHLIDFHRASVIEIMEKNSCIMSDAVGIQCPFCNKKVPHGKTGEQVLLYHMQQLHFSDYEDMIKTKFRPYNGASRESLRSISSGDVSQLAPFQPGVTSTPGLSNKLGTMALSTDARRSVEALNLDATWSSHGRTFKSPMPPPQPPPKDNQKQQQDTRQEEKPNKQLPSSSSKGILRHQSGLNRRPSVKRELRFSVPPVTSEEVFVPDSPEQTTLEQLPDHVQEQLQDQQSLEQPQQQHGSHNDESKRIIPIRVDSLSAADFMDLTEKIGGQRKRRRLGLGLRSRKAFKKREKENIGEREISSLVAGASKIMDGAKRCITEGPHVAKSVIIPTPATRTFRRPKPVAVPRVPELPPPPSTVQATVSECPVSVTQLQAQTNSAEKESISDASPFTNLKLYSPLRMFRCNSCRVKFCDNESLSGHIGSRHKGLLYLLRPQYGCGVCSARFFENKYLVKHCLQHHTSLLEIRSPRKHKITIYRVTQD